MKTWNRLVESRLIKIRNNALKHPKCKGSFIRIIAGFRNYARVCVSNVILRTPVVSGRILPVIVAIPCRIYSLHTALNIYHAILRKPHACVLGHAHYIFHHIRNISKNVMVDTLMDKTSNTTAYIVACNVSIVDMPSSEHLNAYTASTLWILGAELLLKTCINHEEPRLPMGMDKYLAPCKQQAHLQRHPDLQDR